MGPQAYGCTAKMCLPWYDGKKLTATRNLVAALRKKAADAYAYYWAMYKAKATQ